MADQVDNVTIRLGLKDEASGPAAKIAAAIKGVGTAAKGVGSGSAAGGGFGALFGAGAGVSVALTGLNLLKGAVSGIFGKLEQAIQLARDSAEAQDRLRASLGDSVAQFDAVSAAAADVASKTRFSADALTQVAQQLADRGVTFDQLPKALLATADVAAALRKPLGDVAEQIAVTFGGTVPRDLRHAVPALQELSKEALESGAALDVLEKRFGGRAIADALTPTGQQVAAARNLADAYRDLGAQLLPVVEHLDTLRDRLAASALSEVTYLVKDNGAALKYVGVDLLRQIASYNTNRGADGKTWADQLDAVEQQMVQGSINADRAADHGKLLAEGNAARQQISDLYKDIAAQTAAFDADQSGKHLAAVQKDLQAEARLRLASTADVLAAIDKAAAANRDPLKARLTDLAEQAGSVAGSADSERVAANAAPIDSDEQNRAAVAEAGYLATLRACLLAMRSSLREGVQLAGWAQSRQMSPL